MTSTTTTYVGGTSVSDAQQRRADVYRDEKPRRCMSRMSAIVERTGGVAMPEWLPGWFVVVVLWGVWTWINVSIAKAKNLDGAGVAFLSIIFSPLLGYLYTAAMPVQPARADSLDYLSRQTKDRLIDLDDALRAGRITKEEHEARVRKVLVG